MKAVLFDLDDTLYPEIEFVRSGFRVVAHYLGSRHCYDEDVLFERVFNILQIEGRGKVFDSLLQALDLYSEDKVKLLVYLYRSHRPTIRMYEDVLPTVEHLRSWGLRLGIVTDGMASVQRNKIAALGLDSIFDAIVCSDELGRDCWKPSAIPYKVILELLHVSPSEAIYVGDDPTKDFIGPNSMEMLTIQVKRQEPQDDRPDAPSELFRARFVVEGLGDILPIVGGKGDAFRNNLH